METLQTEYLPDYEPVADLLTTDDNPQGFYAEYLSAIYADRSGDSDIA